MQENGSGTKSTRCLEALAKMANVVAIRAAGDKPGMNRLGVR